MEPEKGVAELRHRLETVESGLGERVAVLERRLGALEGRLAAAAPPPPPVTIQTSPRTAASTVSMPPPPPSPSAARLGPPPRTPPPPSTPAARPGAVPFEIGVEALLRWAGIGLVVLSAIFLVSTAISRGWIGPELQLLGATVIGFSLLGTALRLVERHRGYGLAFGTGGAVVVVVCAGAAYSWLNLYSAGVALFLVAVAAAVSVAAAARLRLQAVAVTATAAMFIVPTLAEILADAPVLGTGVWLGLFAVAATVTGVREGWHLYRLASVWVTALWILGLAGTLYDDGNTNHAAAGIALVAVVGGALWLSPLLADRRSTANPNPNAAANATGTAAGGGGGRWDTFLVGLDHRSALLVPLWFWGSVLLFTGLSADDPGGWIGLLLAAGFAALAGLAGPIERWISNLSFGSHLLGAGILVTVAAMTWLGGPVLMVFLAAQAVATLVVALAIGDRWLTVNAYLLAVVAWLLLAAGLAEILDHGAPPWEEHAGHLAVVALLGLLAWLTAGGRRSSPSQLPGVSGPSNLLDLSGLVNLAAWSAVVGVVCSLVGPHIDDRDWLVVGVVVTAAGLAAAKRLGIHVLGFSALAGVITVAGAAVSIIDAADRGTDVAGHLANLSVIAALAAGTHVLWQVVRNTELARPFLVITWLGGLGWLASVLLAVPQGQVALTTAWAIAACAALVAAVRTNDPVIRFLGLGTLALVLVKLLSVDLAEVDTLWRVGLFLVIGLGLLRLGYVLPELARRYGPADELIGNGPDR